MKYTKIKIEFEVEDLWKLQIEGRFTVNSREYSGLSLWGLKQEIKKGLIK